MNLKKIPFWVRGQSFKTVLIVWESASLSRAKFHGGLEQLESQQRSGLYLPALHQTKTTTPWHWFSCPPVQRISRKESLANSPHLIISVLLKCELSLWICPYKALNLSWQTWREKARRTRNNANIRKENGQARLRSVLVDSDCSDCQFRIWNWGI